MSLTVWCDICGCFETVRTTPSGSIVLPPRWIVGTAILKGETQPREAVHSCGGPDCKLIGHVPPGEPKEETWGMSGTR